MRQCFFAMLILATFVAATLSDTQAQAVSNANRQKLTENFTQADANRDAVLTLDEFTKLLELNAEDNLGKAAQIVKSGRSRMAFNRIDADRNGLLTQQELQAFAE